MSQPVNKEVSQKYCYRFGKIAVDKGFVTEAQLKDGIIEQLEDDLHQRPHRMIGRILFEKGWITSEQIETVLNELFKKKKEAEE